MNISDFVIRLIITPPMCYFIFCYKYNYSVKWCAYSQKMYTNYVITNMFYKYLVIIKT